MAISRRSFVYAGAGAALTGATRTLASSDARNDPPRFETARHQFRLLRPIKAVPLTPLTRIDGRLETLADFRGKVVLLNFWASWCPACRTELPLLDRLQEAAGIDRLRVMAVSVDKGGRATVESFLRKLNLRHLAIYLDSNERLTYSGADNRNGAPFALYGMPLTYIITPSGYVAGYMPGEADWTSDQALSLLRYYEQI